MKRKRVVVVLTADEALELLTVIGQGWGDGDHAEWLGSKKKATTCVRAISKLRKAYRNALQDADE